MRCSCIQTPFSPGGGRFSCAIVGLSCDRRLKNDPILNRSSTSSISSTSLTITILHSSTNSPMVSIVQKGCHHQKADLRLVGDDIYGVPPCLNAFQKELRGSPIQLRRGWLAPIPEAPALQTLGPKAVTGPIPVQHSDLGGPAVDEDEAMPRQGILGQGVPHHGREFVEGLAHIHWDPTEKTRIRPSGKNISALANGDGATTSQVQADIQRQGFPCGYRPPQVQINKGRRPPRICLAQSSSLLPPCLGAANTPGSLPMLSPPGWPTGRTALNSCSCPLTRQNPIPMSISTGISYLPCALVP